ncbi:complex I NDUFA9 subunit family protein [Pseudochelatococcus contaminans]|uniref:NADH dehydrogenase n=1 Tax=Pseudochelatococcus contaminans TaxID=1538103 RepID=A0A7W5Z4N4_9HYPH|nr:complex I NDUFA9 subunit family protein [Pseudochelatococcus contaminans]MBB3809657.1 NADH dehydrogenase [Pseudochelatococcus contaminans]
MAEVMLRSAELVTVFGGSGFLGRHVVRALAQRGYRVRVAVRRPDLAGHLQPLGVVGQIAPVQANVRFAESVKRAVEGSDVVINLVGILQQIGRQNFKAVQEDGARVVAEAAAAHGVRLVHVSAIGADKNSNSLYARTKALGEEAVFSAAPDAVVFRPSIIFGRGDGFFTRFAALARALPVLPIVGAQTRFQPVYAVDVAEAIARAVDGAVAGGKIYEIGGPQVQTLRQLVTHVQAVTGRQRPVISLPFGVARVQAGIIEFLDKLTLGLLPDALVVTPDQVKLLALDNVVSAEAIAEGRTLEGLGIAPSAYEAIVADYLWRFRKSGQFTEVRI